MSSIEDKQRTNNLKTPFAYNRNGDDRNFILSFHYRIHNNWNFSQPYRPDILDLDDC